MAESVSRLIRTPTTKKLGIPVSAACYRFVQNSQDMRDFYSLHQAVSKVNVPLISKNMHVANKAVIVLIAAMWEAYCEDLADESLAVLVEFAPSWKNLPQPLLKSVTKDLKTMDDLGPWMLADDGWRDYLIGRQPKLMQKRNYSFATPKTEQVNRLFLDSVGIVNIASKWELPHSADHSARELDKYIDMRNVIAHRYSPGQTVAKKEVREFYKLIAFLVAQTDSAVGEVIEQVTGQSRWAERADPEAAI
jgi:hypothetical protein